jgi:hypothetical protein
MLREREYAVRRTSSRSQYNQSHLTAKVGWEDAFLESEELFHRKGLVADFSVDKALTRTRGQFGFLSGRVYLLRCSPERVLSPKELHMRADDMGADY